MSLPVDSIVMYPFVDKKHTPGTVHRHIGLDYPFQHEHPSETYHHHTIDYHWPNWRDNFTPPALFLSVGRLLLGKNNSEGEPVPVVDIREVPEVFELMVMVTQGVGASSQNAAYQFVAGPNDPYVWFHVQKALDQNLLQSFGWLDPNREWSCRVINEIHVNDES